MGAKRGGNIKKESLTYNLLGYFFHVFVLDCTAFNVFFAFLELMFGPRGLFERLNPFFIGVKVLMGHPINISIKCPIFGTKEYSVTWCVIFCAMRQ
jgi:hypothetical protein